MNPADLLDPATLERAVAAVIAIVTTYGLSVIGAILMLILGWVAASWVGHAIWTSLGRISRVDAMLRGFISSMVKYFILAVTVIAVLGQFGVQTTSFVAVMGAAGLAIGLALQGTLSNLAGGVMLLIFRPFKVGDFINGGGHIGAVKNLTLFTTELATPDNVLLIVPNSDLWGHAITNFSINPTRRFDIAIGVSYSDDLEKALQVMRDTCEAEARVLKDPAPNIYVDSLGDNAVNLVARVWSLSSDFWALRSDLTRDLKLAFDRNGLSIPYPQRDLHVFIDNAAAIPEDVLAKLKDARIADAP
jgi:small conductance mechanosensitive channel